MAKKKYQLQLGGKPSDVDAPELALVMGIAGQVSSLAKKLNIDPTELTVEHKYPGFYAVAEALAFYPPDRCETCDGELHEFDNIVGRWCDAACCERSEDCEECGAVAPHRCALWCRSVRAIA